MRRPMWVVGVLALALAALAGPAAQADPRGVDPVPGLPVYLALGDSIANGQESAPRIVDEATTFAGWRANGYVAQFGAILRDRLDCSPAASDAARSGCRALQVVNLARSAVPSQNLPGVTTQVVIDEQLEPAVAMLESRNGDANPRNDVEVVTITVGGNDIFGPVTSACLGPDPGACGAAIQAAFASFGANYARILSELRAAAGPGTPIVTMTYYNPLPYCALGQANPAAGAFADWFLEGGTLPGLGTLDVGFNDVIRMISARAGAQVADTFGDLGAGDFVGGSDCLHPVRVGHTKIAAAFSEALFG